MNKHNSLSSNLVSSPRWYIQVLGAMIMSKTKALIFVLVSAAILYTLNALGDHKCFNIAAATIGVFVVIHVVRKLNPIYCLQKEEERITWSQIVLLASLGIWLIVVILQISKDFPNLSTFVSITGAVLSWIFQDTIKSVVAFFYLRINNQLKIGDWIEVKSKGIDGKVKGISLTTVIIENWDTTTSSFPTYILHSDHFKNNQKMMDGKTYGRQMQKTFIIDTGWIHSMSQQEIDKLKEIILKKDNDDNLNYCISQHAKDGVLNIQLYRLYLYHWLMNHSHVSHEPRLIVRWLEQTNEGLPLQIYVFITDSNLAPFEWQQSQIMEHAIEALAWFNLQLYQSPSGYDASNSNIKLVDKEADYRRKITDNGEIL